MSNSAHELQIKVLVESGEAEIKTGPFGTQLKASDYVSNGIPVINVRNVGFGDIRPNKLEFINDHTADRLSSHLLKRNDIVFGRKGAVERHAFIKQEQHGWLQGSDCIRLRIKSDRINPRYLSYCFQVKKHQQWMMAQCSHGATMASLNQDIISRIPICLPAKDMQDKVVSILESYDNLIENNNHRITILEEMAQSLYREWFVKFRFPGHEQCHMVDSPLGLIPSDWKVVSLSELMEIKGGSQPPKKEWSDAPLEGYVRMIQIRDYQKDSYIAYVKESKSLRRCSKEEILIARYGASVARIVFGLDGAYNVALAKVIEKQQHTREFLRNFLKSDFFQKTLIGMSGRAAQNGFNKGDIAAINLAIPCSSDLFQEFEQIGNPILKQILVLKSSNKALQAKRGLLLPKLISGQIEL